MSFSMNNRDKGDTFSIDSTTGRIFLNKEIDREVQDSHVIRVTASDGGGRTAVCEMKVQVQDVNDSEPQFNNFKNQIQVSTDVKEGEILYEFDVTDLGKMLPLPAILYPYDRMSVLTIVHP